MFRLLQVSTKVGQDSRPLQRPVWLVAVEQLAMNKNLVMFASVIS